MPRQAVAIEPSVIKWARESIGLSPRAAARDIGVQLTTLNEWENGKGGPTIGQLRKMAKAYKRPVTALMQPDVPPDMPMPKDYRTIGGLAPRLSPDALLAIRDAQRVQMIATELVDASEGIMPPLKITQHSREDSASEVGMLDRDAFDIDYSTQTKFGGVNRAYNAWRTRLQLAGMLVLSKPMHPKDCRGFSLVGKVPVIVVNSNEVDQAKIFTLLHEYAHLTLNQTALCQERDTFTDEKWCNRFAASLLIPEPWLLWNVSVAKVGSTREVERLAKKFRASRHVIALRLREIGRADNDLYSLIKAEDDERDFYRPEPTVHEEEKEEQRGGPTQARRRLTELGIAYTGAVIGALSRGIVDLREAGDYLNVGPRSFDPLVKSIEDTISRYG